MDNSYLQQQQQQKHENIEKKFNVNKNYNQFIKIPQKNDSTENILNTSNYNQEQYCEQKTLPSSSSLLHEKINQINNSKSIQQEKCIGKKF